MTDISELVKRLRGYPEIDECEEAADALEAQAKEIEAAALIAQDNAAEYVRRIKDARIEDLKALLKDCADDLEAEIEARYGQSKSHQPLKYACDMVPVIAARAALNGEKG